jgi:hypothetical protein
MDPVTLAAMFKGAEIAATIIARNLDALGNANTDRTTRNHQIAIAVQEAKDQIEKDNTK